MEEENFTDMNTSPEHSKEKSVEARDANNIVLNIIPESEARLATITTEAPKPRPFTSPKPVAMRSQRHFFNIFRWPDKEARVQTSSLFTPLELQMAGGLKWTWVRRCVLAAFWLTWISLLASALVIIVRTPECKLLPRLRWWQRKPMYRIAMQSYYDTNGDGFGDLLGIQRKIEYIQKLHVGSIIIMPFNSYKANSTDLAVNERFGHIQDLKSLLKTAARSEIKVILDLTPNPALIDEYFWANIDFRDGDMLEWLLSDFRFWFRKGVDGIFIRMKINHLEKTLLLDLLKSWKDISRQYSTSAKKRVFVIATSKDDNSHIVSILNNVQGNMIFVYYLPDLITNPGLLETAKTLDDYDAKMESAWSGFFFTKGHISSVMTKEDVGNKYRLFIMLLFSIPGTPIIFYGEEIGLKDYQASAYPLMRWDNSKYSGFTKGLPWITPDLNSNTPTVTQQTDDPLSTLTYYWNLVQLRHEEPPLQFGDFHILANRTDFIAYIRQQELTGILVVLNFGDEISVDFTGLYLPKLAILLAKSRGLTPCQVINLHEMEVEANTGYILKYFINN